jgi:small subunit ribosomal protein S7
MNMESHKIAKEIYDLLFYPVEVKDMSIKKYVNTATSIKLGGLLTNTRFGKAKVNIIDRLIGHLMVPGHKGKDHYRTSKIMTGKYNTAFNLLMDAFQIIKKSKGMNPMEVLIRAIENSAPREGVTYMIVAGQRLARQADLSPLKRIDLVLRWIAQGTYQTAAASHRPAKEVLAEILISASKNDPNSYLISKRIELEKQAAASR